MRTVSKQKRLVTDEKDLPDFNAMDPDEEAAWWDANDVAEHLLHPLTPAEQIAFDLLLPTDDAPRSEEPGEGGGKRAAA